MPIRPNPTIRGPGTAMSTGEIEAGGDELVQFNVRIHPEARRRLRIAAAESDRGIEEIVREILYPSLGFTPGRPTPPQSIHPPGSETGACLKRI